MVLCKPGAAAWLREMALSGHQELFVRFRLDRTAAAFEVLVRACRPLVASVCRRYLRHPEDVDDAVQETFLRLATHIDTIQGDVKSWLAVTAHSISVDLIRRALRERRRRLALRTSSPITFDASEAQRRLVRAAVHLRLGEALLVLEDASRELIVQRFFRRTPLRVLAGRSGQSVATVSRRATAALADLVAVLRDMGMTSLDEPTLVELFGGPGGLASYLELDAAGEELRFAPDWRTPLFAPTGSQAVSPVGPFWPGWSRRIRVGVLTSYLSSITPGSGRGTRHDVEVQVRTTEYLGNPAFQLIGIAEPGTTDRGPVERVLRNYELTGGLIDATDAEGLKTLDVILFGTVFAIHPTVAAAFAEAVRSGVGLLNEWWTGGLGPPQSDPNVRDLMLADSQVYPLHVEPYCTSATHVPATVRHSHPLIPGLRAGDHIAVAACGPIFRPVPAAQVLIEKDMLIPPQQHHIPGLGPARMPAYVVGHLGRGRVVVSLLYMLHARFAEYLDISASQYMATLMAWLAEPQRG